MCHRIGQTHGLRMQETRAAWRRANGCGQRDKVMERQHRAEGRMFVIDESEPRALGEDILSKLQLLPQEHTDNF